MLSQHILNRGGEKSKRRLSGQSRGGDPRPTRKNTGGQRAIRIARGRDWRVAEDDHRLDTGGEPR